MSDSVAPRTAAHQASLSFTSSWNLLKLMFIESVMPSNHHILCRPFPSCLQSFTASGSFLMSQFFTSGGQSIGASAISPSNEYSRLISFRIDWFDLLTVQGTLKSLFQHHNSKASILQCSVFFRVHLSHLYMTIGKTIALTRRTFVGQVMYFHRVTQIIILENMKSW